MPAAVALERGWEGGHAPGSGPGSVTSTSGGGPLSERKRLASPPSRPCEGLRVPWSPMGMVAQGTHERRRGCQGTLDSEFINGAVLDGSRRFNIVGHKNYGGKFPRRRSSSSDSSSEFLIGVPHRSWVVQEGRAHGETGACRIKTPILPAPPHPSLPLLFRMFCFPYVCRTGAELIDIDPLPKPILAQKHVAKHHKLPVNTALHRAPATAVSASTLNG
ncbi:hypothetical protein T492DRAFT_833581 [Pavlovales sp. CCMP2436]|nr:hypothetical protein T492DRAFT_833581 [Pavlovales sp. CCMP2436]